MLIKICTPTFISVKESCSGNFDFSTNNFSEWIFRYRSEPHTDRNFNDTFDKIIFISKINRNFFILSYIDYWDNTDLFADSMSISNIRLKQLTKY